MKSIILISKCIKKMKMSDGWQYMLRFSGAYHGVYVKKIILYSSKEELEINREYIIHAEILATNNQKLIGNIIRSRDLELIKVS